jgi:NADPH:quinone reductase-like Zn-dependent oxidoreductase
MKAIVLRSPAGLDRLELIDMPDSVPPGPGEIRVRLHASSLNYHDFLVATGRIRTADGRTHV